MNTGHLDQMGESLETAIPAAELTGTCSGHIHTWKNVLPWRISVTRCGHIVSQIGEQLESLINKPRFEDGVLSGRMTGSVESDDAGRKPYSVAVELWRRAETLNGSVTAISLPGTRLGNGLTSWAALRREATVR